MTSGVSEIIDGVRKVDHPLWVRYNHMKSRCLNQSSADYHNYGGRGITVCKEWLNSFEAYVRDIGPQPHHNATVDRINNDKGYYPGNCRWTDRSTQCHNRREFQNNTSGCTGVKRVKSKTCPGWKAVFDDNHVRFDLGVYSEKMAAISTRTTFATMYHNSPIDAIEWLQNNRPLVRRNNTTGVTGVTKMSGVDSGFMVRYYDKKTKCRTYIGARPTIAEAADLMNRYLDARSNGVADEFIKAEAMRGRSNNELGESHIHRSGRKMDYFMVTIDSKSKQFKSLSEAIAYRNTILGWN